MFLFLAKQWIEQRQREEQKQRERKGVKWLPTFFEKNNEDDDVIWRYKHDLLIRDIL